MHSIKGGMINCQKEMKKAVECGYWNLFRFNPAADKKFTLDSKAPAGGYREFLMNEARYSRLTREFPERAEVSSPATRTRPRSVTSTSPSSSTCTTSSNRCFYGMKKEHLSGAPFLRYFMSASSSFSLIVSICA